MIASIEAVQAVIERATRNSTYGAFGGDPLSNASFRLYFRIKDVIFNPPATIVLWADGTKTVVKTQGHDNFNPEVGMALCFMKRAYGNKSRYNNDLKKYTEPYYEKDVMPDGD